MCQRHRAKTADEIVDRREPLRSRCRLTTSINPRISAPPNARLHAVLTSNSPMQRRSGDAVFGIP